MLHAARQEWEVEFAPSGAEALDRAAHRAMRPFWEAGMKLQSGQTVGAPPLTLADSERDLILRALERTGWRIKGPKGAAAALGLNPSTLYSRMKKLGIQPPGPAEDGSA